MSDAPHIPVLLTPVMNYLIGERRDPMRIIDGTLGYGGHSEAMLRGNPAAELLGIDRDENALAFAKNRLSFAEGRVTFAHGTFDELADIASQSGWETVDAILLDIGISSPQIDRAERGFAHRMDGPLDMRMNQHDPITAADYLNGAPFETLVKIFRDYGEIRSAGKLANAVIERRAVKPWETTGELAELCANVIAKPRPGTLPIATLCFQALRIAVNDELGQLARALPAALSILKTGGRLGVISFHSLEDRMVKQFFADAATDCICPPSFPVCRCDHPAQGKILTRKPIIADDAEAAANPRAKCAKLRVIEKLEIKQRHSS